MKRLLDVVSNGGLCAEISGPGCKSDSSRTGLSTSQHGASIKKGPLPTHPSAGGSTKRRKASSLHTLMEKVPSVQLKMRGGGCR